MSIPAIELRPATWEDCQLLLDWANEPLTRQNSFDPRPIAVEDHLEWLRRRLSEEGTRIYVATLVGIPCGVIRFERREEGTAEVSVTLDPGFRGRGLSAGILRSATERYRAEVGSRRIVARVKEGNTASMRAFERAGYRLAGSDGGVSRFEAG